MFLEYLGTFLIVLTLSGTILSLIKTDFWLMRSMDFPRLQLVVFGLTGIAFYLSDGLPNSIGLIFLCLTVLAVLFQVIKIAPYTVLFKKQVRLYNVKNGSAPTISFVICNVRMKNKKYHEALRLFLKVNADVLLMVETDEEWYFQTKEIEKLYPYHIKIPLGNTYGMILYSKFQLLESKIHFLIQDDIPSIETLIKLPSGESFYFYGVHPRPPAPKESSSSLPRDAELVMVAKKVQEKTKPVIVAGDLNDVAWSSTTRLFQNISGLLDPRRGRGFFSTYHAQIPFFRWPLDYLFHSKDFQLVEIKKLEHIHSDHFPIWVKLAYVPDKKNTQEEPNPSQKELKEAENKIKEVKKRFW